MIEALRGRLSNWYNTVCMCRIFASPRDDKLQLTAKWIAALDFNPFISPTKFTFYEPREADGVTNYAGLNRKLFK